MPVINHHMDVINIDDLEALFTDNGGPCVSLFMPTERAGSEIQQNPIRLKNLIAQTEAELAQTALTASEQKEMLASLKSLQQDHPFWQQQNEGLAVYAAPERFDSYRLPLAFDELAVVSHRFHVKPLLPIFSRDQRFFLLTLSLDQTQLFQATHYSMGEIRLEGVPTSLDEALRFDDPERETQFHTSTDAPASPGMRDAIFHGHSPEEDRKSDIVRFFRKVNKGVMDVLADEQAPLVLMGLDYLHPLYREANTYPHLVDEGIVGNPAAFEPQEWHTRAWEIVKLRLDDTRDEAVDRYHALAAQGNQTSGSVMTVLPAAVYGRVDTLFVARDIQVWGEFDPEESAVRLHPAASPNNADLLDMAAAQTIINGGSVYVVEVNQIPGETPVAAIFRY